MQTNNVDYVRMTNEVTVAFLGRNAASPQEVAAIMKVVHQTLMELAAKRPTFAASSPKPAVPVAASVSANSVICLECAKRLKALKQHLRGHGLTAASYRAKWALSEGHPLVAPNLTALRSALAHANDFGRHTGRRGRKPKDVVQGRSQ